MDTFTVIKNEYPVYVEFLLGAFQIVAAWWRHQPGCPPWAVHFYRQAGPHRPHEAKQCDNLEYTTSISFSHQPLFIYQSSFCARLGFFSNSLCGIGIKYIFS
jgi:hypothetical protein